MNSNNKSLFLYTALIFFVAVILIILAFFGQTHINNSQITTEEQAQQINTAGITEKASAVSEENVRLIQEVAQLKEDIISRDEKINELQAQIDAFAIIQDNNAFLFHAYESKISGNEDDLKEILSTINYEQLTVQQKAVYDELNK